MKKMLMLVLILGMVAAANATVSLTVSGNSTPGSGTLSLYVVPEPTPGTSTTAQVDMPMAICIKGTGTLSLGTIGANAPADAADTDCSLAMLGREGIYGNGEIWNMTSFISVYPEGVWLTATYSGAVAGDKITAYESVGGNFDEDPIGLSSNTITIIPEPVTMALLGLGGLFLRRRK